LAEDAPDAIARKVEKARREQGAWAATPLAERKKPIAAFAAALEKDEESLAARLTSEMGKPIAQSRNELTALQGRIRFFLDDVEAALADEVVHEKEGWRETISYEPLGLVANVSAWNYPYFVGSNVFVPALLCGNAVLYKPSEFATMTGRHIVETMHEAGVPVDVFIAVIGSKASGAALLRQPIDAVFFTGSYATGEKIGAIAGRKMIKVQLELGGKDPVYVCEDVDIKAAAAGIADGSFYNTGQSCCSVERIYVHEKVHDAFVAAFVAEVKGYKIGDPLDETTYIGAITRRPQLDVLTRQAADAKRKGAKLLTGGSVIKRKGNWFEPTVFVGVDHRMAL